ncbi:MAG: diaminopimelate decarboxylase [Candidatus Woesearchaeota archaeon]|jgi:diaminopimelate decarboxylase
MIDNETLRNVAKIHETPTYVYDELKIIEQYTKLQNAIPWKSLKIFYAMKANYNPHILNLLKNLGANIDAVSIGEIILAKKIGFDSTKIIYTPNNIDDKELINAKKEQIIFNIDSLSLLERFGKLYPSSEICLRFNPEIIDGEHEHVQTSGIDTKFGLALFDLKQVLIIIKKYNLTVIGLHEHIGSGICNAESFLNSLEIILNLATKENFPDLKFVDIGGGFKVNYHPQEPEIDYNIIGEKITTAFQKYCATYGRELELFVEPGKYLVADAGSLLIEVTTIKNIKNKTIIGTNSGFSHLIRPILYGAYHNILNISNPTGQLKEYDIYGNICESGDCFAKNRLLPEIKEGHLLLIETSGAYGYSMGSTYNFRPMPAEVLITRDKIKLIRLRTTPEELAEQIISDCELEKK